MPALSRRDLIAGAFLTGAGLALQGCAVDPSIWPSVHSSQETPESRLDAESRSQFVALYGQIDNERFPVPDVDLSQIDPVFLRQQVAYGASDPPGTIIIEPSNHYLYLVQDRGQAMRYGVGVGREGFAWSGVANIHDKQEWPDWYPPKEMIQRQPEVRKALTKLQGGLGMPGGPGNPLGARAMYLWQGKKDTLYRIHGTVEPWTIGKSVSSGCIRMINQDAIDLYQRAPVGTRVVVLPSRIG
jgi:lipoprotein-anchoring transpeptidase ErfK/SrfK